MVLDGSRQPRLRAVHCICIYDARRVPFLECVNDMQSRYLFVRGPRSTRQAWMMLESQTPEMSDMRAEAGRRGLTS